MKLNQRSMTGPRRVDTRWPQTEQMLRRVARVHDNPYRRRRPRVTWGGIVDAACWVIVACAASWLVWCAVSTAARNLRGIW